MPKKGTKYKKSSKPVNLESVISSFQGYRKTLEQRVRQANDELRLCNDELRKVDGILLSLQPQETDQLTGG